MERQYRTTQGQLGSSSQHWGTPELVSTVIIYKDGLGRESQQVFFAGSPDMKDLIIKKDYDEVFRLKMDHLPQPGSGANGQYRDPLPDSYYSVTGTNANVTNPTVSPYTLTLYDNSPLNRVKELRGPGITTGLRRTYKIGGPGIKYYQFTDVGVMQQTGEYPAGSLQIVESQDESNKKTEEFIDRSGRVIAKRVGGVLITYYVYNQKGLLRYVLQPAYQGNSDLNKFAFEYVYDEKDRIVSKRIPGQGTIILGYDTRDRLISMTDGAGQNFYYDYEDGNNRQKEMGTKNGTVKSPLVRTWYDTYSFGPFKQFTNEMGLIQAEHFHGNPGSDNKKGLVTGREVRVLNADGSYGDFLKVLFFYDQKGRLIQTWRQLYGGGNEALERISLKLDFLGSTIGEHTTQTMNSSSYRLEKDFIIDHQNRPVSITNRLFESNNGQTGYVLKKNYTHVVNIYNKVGLLAEKKLHGNIQKIEFKYRPNGWLSTVINNGGKPFGVSLGYADNGNVTSLSWNTSGFSGSFTTIEYDFANRLTKAEGDQYKENNILYDPNGNITALARKKGSIDIDELVYTYDGGGSNRLMKVVDIKSNAEGFDNGSSSTGDDYTYDGNGNLTKDLNKGVTSIDYNVLNLPRKLSGRNMLYSYDGLGNKLKTEASPGSTRFYAGNFEYNATNLARIGLEEGQLVRDSNGDFEVHYYLKDHLGNVRMVLREDGTVLQETEYFPFGMAINRSGNDATNKYLYQGKEKQPEIATYDFGARMYDPTIGRTFQVDPMSESYYPWSPYGWVMNNPLKFMDPTGMFSTHTDEEGNVVAVYDDGDLGVYKHQGKGDAAASKVQKEYSTDNTGAGGERMGESLHALSFADQNLYNRTGEVARGDIKIDFGSTELTDRVQEIIDSPSVIDYFNRAGSNGPWDIKAHVSNGSLLYGRYASPRDAGNFAAGAVAQLSGIGPIVQYGFGAYNLTGNNKLLTGALTAGVAFLTRANPGLGLGAGYLIGKYGEDKLSQRSIDIGKDFIRGRR